MELRHLVDVVRLQGRVLDEVEDALGRAFSGASLSEDGNLLMNFDLLLPDPNHRFRYETQSGCPDTASDILSAVSDDALLALIVELATAVLAQGGRISSSIFDEEV